jgi:excisionase family DNA binding protein
MTAAEVHDLAVDEQLASLQPLDGPPLKAPAAAAALDVGIKTLYHAIERGEIRAVRLGRAIRVPRAEIARLLGIGP